MFGSSISYQGLFHTSSPNHRPPAMGLSRKQSFTVQGNDTSRCDSSTEKHLCQRLKTNPFTDSNMKLLPKVNVLTRFILSALSNQRISSSLIEVSWWKIVAAATTKLIPGIMLPLSIRRLISGGFKSSQDWSWHGGVKVTDTPIVKATCMSTYQRCNLTQSN